MRVKATARIGGLLFLLAALAVAIAQTYQPDEPVPPGSAFNIIDLESRIIDLESRVIDHQFRVEAVPDVEPKPLDGKASGPHSMMSSDFLYLPANPDAVATLTIRVADGQGQPLPGKRVQVKSALSDGPADTIIQPEAPTDARGITTARVKSILPPHSARFSALVLEDNVEVGQNVEIEVQKAGPPSLFVPGFAPYFDERFVVSPMPLKVGQLTSFKVPLTNRRHVPVEIRVLFFGTVPNIGLGHWPKIGETDLFVLQPGESREAKVTWTPTVASKLCAKVEVWGRELPQAAADDGIPRLIAIANPQKPGETSKAGAPSKMDSRQQNLGTVSSQPTPVANLPQPPDDFDPPWWWPIFNLAWGAVPDPSPPGFDPLNPTHGPKAVEGGIKMGKGWKATEALNNSDSGEDTEAFYRTRNLSTADLLKESGNKKKPPSRNK